MPEPKDESRLERDERNTEIRRETQIRDSMGQPSDPDEPKVTPESDVFKDEPPPSDRSER
jgi:hypothetical protein